MCSMHARCAPVASYGILNLNKDRVPSRQELSPCAPSYYTRSTTVSTKGDRSPKRETDSLLGDSSKETVLHFPFPSKPVGRFLVCVTT